MLVQREDEVRMLWKEYFEDLWLFSVYMDGMMKEVKMRMRRRGVRFLEDERKWGLPDLLYADDLVLYGESEKDLSAMMGWCAEVCRRRGLKSQCR